MECKAGTLSAQLIQSEKGETTGGGFRATVTQGRSPGSRAPRPPPDSRVHTCVVSPSNGNGKPGTLLSSMLNKTPNKANR